jgi:Domain of unknown function (DUF4189)
MRRGAGALEAALRQRPERVVRLAWLARPQINPFALAHRPMRAYVRARTGARRHNRENGSMRRRSYTIVALLAFAYGLLPATSAVAGYGAIAWDKVSGKAGWVWNQSTPQKATEAAISKCGASGCRLVIKPTTACAALATTGNGKYIGAAARKTQDEARLAALTDCQKGKAGDCVVRASNCNK